MVVVWLRVVELAGVEAGRMSLVEVEVEVGGAFAGMSLVEVEVEVGGAFADCSSLPGLKP